MIALTNSPAPLSVMKFVLRRGLTLALHVKMVSIWLNGDNVRLLVNSNMEPLVFEIVTWLSLRDSAVPLLSHMISRSSGLTSMSVAELKEITQVRVRFVSPI